jgi:amidase
MDITRRAAAQALGLSVAGKMLASSTPELCTLTALELANLIRQRKVTAQEVMAAHLKQIERVNPKVNAIITLLPEQAIENARRADQMQTNGGPLGPLHGLPIAHKDLVETAGIRTTFGSPLMKFNVPTEDDIIVERIRNAGAIAIGKTNTPEFGAGSQTFNAVFGATRNPYDLTKTCGGSSGGAAVSLTSNMLPIADGSDSGGSLRNPAAFCNVVGFRTAPGRVPQRATRSGWSTLGVQGPMARTVSDAALLLSVMAGPDSRCPIAIAEPGQPLRQPLQRDFKNVRVAWFKNLGGTPFDPEILRVVNAQRKTFENLGCIVEEAEPDLAGGEEAYRTFRCLGYASTLADAVRTHPELVKDTLHWEVERGLKVTGPDLIRAQKLHAEVWERMRIFGDKYEYFIVPSTQAPPFDVSQPYPKEIAGTRMQTYIDWMKCCWMITIVENPSISVPCGFTDSGLPVGLQIVGRHRSEFSVLQLAYAFEQATGFGGRRPTL